MGYNFGKYTSMGLKMPNKNNSGMTYITRNHHLVICRMVYETASR